MDAHRCAEVREPKGVGGGGRIGHGHRWAELPACRGRAAAHAHGTHDLHEPSLGIDPHVARAHRLRQRGTAHLPTAIVWRGADGNRRHLVARRRHSPEGGGAEVTHADHPLCQPELVKGGRRDSRRREAKILARIAVPRQLCPGQRGDSGWGERLVDRCSNPDEADAGCVPHRLGQAGRGRRELGLVLDLGGPHIPRSKVDVAAARGRPAEERTPAGRDGRIREGSRSGSGRGRQ